MKTIIILCGFGEAGKTKTLKEFFGVSLNEKLDDLQLLKRSLDGKKSMPLVLVLLKNKKNFAKWKMLKTM